MKGLGRTIAVTICIGVVVISTSGRGTETQEAGCSFTISGTLVARPGSDHDTLGFAGSTFKLEVQATADVTATIETRTKYDREYKTVTFDLTSSSALVWKPSGSPFDGTYSAPVKLILINDDPSWPGSSSSHDDMLLEARLDIGGKAYKFRMTFSHNESQLFDESELGEICAFQRAGTADLISQSLERVPDYSEGYYGLQVEDFVFTTSP